ncbi:MAG: mechanosensitive ion channel [Chloroflexi bacterium]|nr:mechanosensitive ion channel [Chloroflexota bacterium]
MEYYGNTIVEWLIVFGLILASFVAGKVIYWIFGRWIKFLTRKTKTQLDDLIVDMVEEPIVAVVILFGIRFSLERLNLPDAVDLWSERGFHMVIALIISWLIARLYDALHEAYLIPMAARTETDLDDQILGVSKAGIRIIAWGLGIVVGLNNAGYNVGAILAGLGVGGFAFALAAQHALENLIGGVNIHLDQHIKLENRIQLRGNSGRMIDGIVTDIGFRTLKVKTRYEGRIVSIPNSVVSNQDIVNVDTEDGRQMFATYKLAPDTSYENIQLALDLLKGIAKSHENTQDLVVTGLAQITDISKDIILLYWIKPEASNLKTRTAINLEIVKQFKENGIRFTDRSRYEYQKEVYL